MPGACLAGRAEGGERILAADNTRLRGKHKAAGCVSIGLRCPKRKKNDLVFTLRWQGLVISQKALGSWFSHFLSELPVLDRLCVLLGL
jgi:hypothetical protein